MSRVLLPFVAFIIALTGISYSGCHESKADEQRTGTTARLRNEISQMEQLLSDLRKIHNENVNAYGNNMGATGNSNGLEQISRQNELLESYNSRLEYHRLQLIQSDTSDHERNEKQLKELNEDISRLKNDGEIIRAGLGENVNTHVTK